MYLYLSIFFSTLGMFQFGFQSTVLNVPQTQIETFFKTTFQKRNLGNLSDSTASTLFSVATSLMLAGGILGALGTGWIGNKFGRRNGLISVQLVALSAAILGGLCDVCDSFEILFISRFMVGLTSGLFTGLVPLYVSEIAPVHLRGAAGTVCNLACTFGLLVAMVLGLKELMGGPNMWPYLLFLPTVPALIQLIFLPLMPESPSYLLINKRDLEQGKKALVRLRGTSNVDKEIQQILQESGNGENNFLENNLSVLQVLRSSKYWLPLFVCACIQLSQQTTGIVALVFYSTTFFEESGLGCSLSDWASISIGGIACTMTLVSVVLMEKLGRRTLHVYVGMTGMIICSIVLNFSLIEEGKNKNDNSTNIDCSDPNMDSGSDEITTYGILVVISTLAYVVLFDLGPASIPWLITAEMFEQAPRAAATSFTMFCNWTSQLIVALVFPQLQSALGSYSFLPFLFMLIVLWAILLVYFNQQSINRG